jgi:flagellar biogenesis protein FliO
VPLVVVVAALLDDRPVLRLIAVEELRLLVGVEGSGVASDFLVPLDILLDDLPNKNKNLSW